MFYKEKLSNDELIAIYDNINVSPTDIIDSIRPFPVAVVKVMLYYQHLQGNTIDIKVFTKKKNAVKAQGGFDWTNAKEGHEFWHRIIADSNFTMFENVYSDFFRKCTANTSFRKATSSDIVTIIKFKKSKKRNYKPIK